MGDEQEQLEAMTEEGELAGSDNRRQSRSGSCTIGKESPGPTPSTPPILLGDVCQWQVGSNGMYRPAASTVGVLPAGSYICGSDTFGPKLVRFPVRSDDIVVLPDAETTRVVEVIRKFWAARERYQRHGLLFKRGILLWGPPGSGKTVTIHMLTNELIAAGGVVIFCGDPDLMSAVMSAVRRIEPTRPLIIVLEDIDEIIRQYGEHGVLAMLDGESQTDNVVFLATTNYIGQLGARIVNRPSRFDERIYVGMPSYTSRLVYLATATRESGLKPADVVRWAEDTTGFSIAHLRELVAAVHCLDQSYQSALDRLKTMRHRPREKDDEFAAAGGFGFGQEQKQAGSSGPARGNNGA